MSDEEKFDQIFSEITSPENIGSMPAIVTPASLNSARDYALLLLELLSAVQEINLIIVNLTESSDEPFQVPIEVIEILEILYAKTKDFNNYMVNLDQDDIGYYNHTEEDDDDYYDGSSN